MTYHLGTNPPAVPSASSAPTAPPAPQESSPEGSAWYKVTPTVLAWLNATYPSDPAVREDVINRVARELVFIGLPPGGDEMYFLSAGSTGNFSRPASSTVPYSVPATAPRMTYQQVLDVFEIRSGGPRFKRKQPAKTNWGLYLGIGAGVAALVGLGVWAGRRRRGQGRPIRENDSSKPRFPVRWGSLERVLSRKTDRATMTAEEMEEFDRADRVALTEEELALVEGAKDALYARISDVDERLRGRSIRVLTEARSIAEDIENHPGYTGVVGPEGDALGGIADEYDGNIPESVLESFLSISKRTPEVQAALRDMVQVAELVSRVYLIVGLIVENEHGALTGEQYELLMRSVGPRIEANRSEVYVFPDRKAYPITKKEDAYRATQRLKQGRVKNAADARKIIQAIRNRFPEIAADYLADVDPQRIEKIHKKSVATRKKSSRLRKSSRRR